MESGAILFKQPRKPGDPLEFGASRVPNKGKRQTQFYLRSLQLQYLWRTAANFPLGVIPQSFPPHWRRFIGAGGESVPVHLQRLSYLALQIRAQQIDMHGRRYAEASLKHDLVCIETQETKPHPPAPTTPTFCSAAATRTEPQKASAGVPLPAAKRRSSGRMLSQAHTAEESKTRVGILPESRNVNFLNKVNSTEV